MRLLETRPCTLLTSFVECYWYVQASAAESSSAPDAILPNGTSNLIFNLSGCPHREYENVSLGSFHSLRTRWLSGIRDRPIVVGPTVQTHIVGVRFKPGGLGVFAQIPPVEFSRLTIDPDELWGSECRSLHDRLLDASSVEEQFASLEDWLLARFNRHAAHGGLLESFELLEALSGRVSVTCLARVADLSARQYRRRFEQAVGITPKVLARMLRFRDLIGRLTPDTAPDWAGIAIDCGYFDQAHLISDFRDFAGVSPGEYLRRDPKVPGFMPLQAKVSVFSNTTETDSTRMTAN